MFRAYTLVEVAVVLALTAALVALALLGLDTAGATSSVRTAQSSADRVLWAGVTERVELGTLAPSPIDLAVYVPDLVVVAGNVASADPRTASFAADATTLAVAVSDNNPTDPHCWVRVRRFAAVAPAPPDRFLDAIGTCSGDVALAAANVVTSETSDSWSHVGVVP